MTTSAFSGRLNYMALKVQAAFDTPLAPTTFPRWLDGSSISPEAKFQEYMEGDGSYDMTLIIKESQMWKGKIVMYARPVTLGVMLAGIFGSGSDTISGMMDPYTHTFAPVATPKFYTFEFGMNDTALTATSALINRVQDCVFTNFLVEATPNQPLKITVEFVGRKATRQTTRLTVSLESSKPYIYTNGVFTLDTVAISGTVSKFNLGFARPVDDTIYTTAISPETFIWVSRKVTIDAEVIFQDNTYFNKIFFGNSGSGTTDSQVMFDGSVLEAKFYVNGDVSDAHTLDMTVNAISWEGKPIDPKLDGKAFRMALTGVALRPASGNLIDTVLKTVTSTAYG